MSKSNFDLSNLALQMVLPNNELIYDDKGMPSVMVKIPKFKISMLLMMAEPTLSQARIRRTHSTLTRQCSIAQQKERAGIL